MVTRANLRGGMGLGGILLALCCGTAPLPAEEAALTPKTAVYKVVGETKIEADIYRADDQILRPAVVWIHGGALIVGSRKSVPKDLLELCRKEGFIMVSIDYRLAQEVKASAIVEDIKDAFRWIRGDGAKQFHIDSSKLVVAGGSAGGYLTMMSGTVVEPRPTALLAYWGYGDIDGEWYVTPSEHYRMTVPLVPKEDALKAVGGAVLTGTEGEVGTKRGRYYMYLRQNGLWTREISGFDPSTEKAKIDPLCPVRNIPDNYPPILMIHGTIDTDVPYAESADMAKALAKRNLPHELITIPNAEHGLRGGDKQLVDDAYARALEFVRKHLK